MEIGDILTTVRGRKIVVEDVVNRLKNQGTFRAVIYQLIESNIIALKCAELDIDLDEEEFFRLREEKKCIMGLSDPLVFQKHLKMNGITYDSFNGYLRTEILREKLKPIIVTEEDIAEFFDDQGDRYSTASIARIVCKTKKKIQGILKEMRADGSDFVVMARKFSLEKNAKFAGGFLGDIRKGTLLPEIEERIFSATPDELIGPISESGFWTLYKVYAVNNAELTDSLRKFIVDQLFSDWFRHEVNTVLA